jgi:hypothetical protein
MQLTYKLVLLNLWKKPKKAFNTINQYNLFKYQIHLFVFAGVTNAVSRRFIDLSDSRHNLLQTLASSIFAGALIGWIGLLVVSGLIYVIGKWIKGQATSTEITNMVAYATVPFVISFVFTAVCVLLLRFLRFQDGTYAYFQSWSNSYYVITKIHSYVNILISLYYFALLVIGISAVQNFSILKSLLNLLICIAVITLPIGLLILYINIR